MGHTPTPWETFSTRSNGEVCIYDKRKPHQLVASAIQSDREYTAADNAAFIVRACNAHDDLLAACKAAFNSLAAFLDYAPDVAHKCYEPQDALSKLRAAIAAAEEER
jgi:hypothetical protein